jgi:hypothetical protein
MDAARLMLICVLEVGISIIDVILLLYFAYAAKIYNTDITLV